MKPPLPRFAGRAEAGGLLAGRLSRYLRSPDATVWAVARGGVIVGRAVALALGLPLDVLAVRQLSIARHPGLTLGAVASGGRILNAATLARSGITDEELHAVEQIERAELRREERLFRTAAAERPARDRIALAIDDAAVTGATLCAAVRALRAQGAARIVAAAPIATKEASASLREEADEVALLAIPDPFHAVNRWYVDFPDVTDQEVCALLAAQR